MYSLVSFYLTNHNKIIVQQSLTFMQKNKGKKVFFSHHFVMSPECYTTSLLLQRSQLSSKHYLGLKLIFQWTNIFLPAGISEILLFLTKLQATNNNHGTAPMQIPFWGCFCILPCILKGISWLYRGFNPLMKKKL